MLIPEAFPPLIMESILRRFKSIPRTTSHLEAAPASYLDTKSHGLHNLGLCKACSDLDLRCLSEQTPHVHLKNCFQLAKTSQKCRLCAYISQTLDVRGSRTVDKVFVARDILPQSEVPLCLSLKEGYLEISSGKFGPVARLQLFSNPGISTERPSTIRSSNRSECNRCPSRRTVQCKYAGGFPARSGYALA